jgi:hypothetical protein
MAILLPLQEFSKTFYTFKNILSRKKMAGASPSPTE